MSSLQVLCMKSIIDNNLTYSILPYFLQDMIYFELHKMKFKDTLYILNTIYADTSNVKDMLLLKVKTVSKDELSDYAFMEEDDEKYNFIFIAFLCKGNHAVFKSTRFIQELNEIEFD